MCHMAVRCTPHQQQKTLEPEHPPRRAQRLIVQRNGLAHIG